MSNGRSRSRTGVHAAITAIAITAGLGAVGVAGADESADEHVLTGAGGPAANGPWQPGNDLTIDTGDSVKWTFTGGFHNVRSTSPNWTLSNGLPDFPQEDATYFFGLPGEYTFVCDAHQPTMTGTVTVVGDPVPTPTSTPPTPSPTATATATPPPTGSPPPPPPPTGGGSHVSTPSPSGADDSVKPRLGSLRLKARRRAIRVRFRLSEPATVTIRVKRRGSRKVIKSARVQARAGTRTVTLRSKRLKKGRYTVEIQARDAGGNRSTLAKKQLRVRR